MNRMFTDFKVAEGRIYGQTTDGETVQVRNEGYTGGLGDSEISRDWERITKAIMSGSIQQNSQSEAHQDGFVVAMDDAVDQLVEAEVVEHGDTAVARKQARLLLEFLTFDQRDRVFTPMEDGIRVLEPISGDGDLGTTPLLHWAAFMEVTAEKIDETIEIAKEKQDVISEKFENLRDQVGITTDKSPEERLNNLVTDLRRFGSGNSIPTPKRVRRNELGGIEEIVPPDDISEDNRLEYQRKLKQAKALQPELEGGLLGNWANEKELQDEINHQIKVLLGQKQTLQGQERDLRQGAVAQTLDIAEVREFVDKVWNISSILSNVTVEDDEDEFVRSLEETATMDLEGPELAPEREPAEETATTSQTQEDLEVAGGGSQNLSSMDADTESNPSETGSDGQAREGLRGEISDDFNEMTEEDEPSGTAPSDTGSDPGEIVDELLGYSDTPESDNEDQTN